MSILEFTVKISGILIKGIITILFIIFVSFFASTLTISIMTGESYTKILNFLLN